MNKLALNLTALALAAALLSTAAAADLAPGKVRAHHAAAVRATSTFAGPTAMTLQTWDVADADGNVFLALCVQPAVALDVNTAVYGNAGAFAGFDGNDNVARLYSQFYTGITGSALADKNESLSFQLALWEMYRDDSNLTAGTQAFRFSQNRPEGQAILNRAAAMIDYATTGTHAIDQRYSFTQYTMAGSQTIVSATAISAVPEPTTWAMLGLGLGLVGCAVRRRGR